MKSRVLLACAATAAVATTRAADDFLEFGRNRILLSGRLGLNFKANFGYDSPNIATHRAGNAVSGTDHDYVDGYVRRDTSGASGSTWNWGYQSVNQIDPAADTISFNSMSGNVNARPHSAETDVLPVGAEVGYERFFGKLGRVTWGLHASAGYTSMSIKDSTFLLSDTLDLITDTYSLGGITPPPEGYLGSFNGPGPLIDDTPVRKTQTARVGTIGILGSTVPRDLSLSLIGLKVGPTFEIPVGRRVGITLSAGLAGAYIDAEFKVREAYFFNLVSFDPRVGDTSKSDFQVGGYIQGRIGMRGSGLFAGFEYQYLPDYTIHSVGRNAKLGFGEGIYLFGGVAIGF